MRPCRSFRARRALNGQDAEGPLPHDAEARLEGGFPRLPQRSGVEPRRLAQQEVASGRIRAGACKAMVGHVFANAHQCLLQLIVGYTIEGEHSLRVHIRPLDQLLDVDGVAHGVQRREGADGVPVLVTQILATAEIRFLRGKP